MFCGTLLMTECAVCAALPVSDKFQEDGDAALWHACPLRLDNQLFSHCSSTPHFSPHTQSTRAYLRRHNTVPLIVSLVQIGTLLDL